MASSNIDVTLSFKQLDVLVKLSCLALRCKFNTGDLSCGLKSIRLGAAGNCMSFHENTPEEKQAANDRLNEEIQLATGKAK